MKLPDDFIWVEALPGEAWIGARLQLDGHDIVEVQPCRSGWLVKVLLDDPDNPQANVAVRSVAAGMRWSARWARSRVSRLRMLITETTNTPPMDALASPSASKAGGREILDA